MADVMMKLGGYTFSVDTAAYQELVRVSEYRWVAQERVGQLPTLQNTGPGTETMTVQGVVYPAHKGGIGQLDDMRAEAGRERPLTLVDGRGFVHGRWVIERIEERQAVFAQAGAPRRQNFSMQLRRYSYGI